MGRDIKKIVTYYSKLYDTNNPFIIADNLNIQVFQQPLGKLSGYYKYLKHHRCIFINSDIVDDCYRSMVMAHELGHAILHVKDNCYFLNSNTFLLTSKLEKQANIFAAELLLTDNFLNDCDGLNIEQISCLTGVNINLVKLKMERF